jgi:twitching motility protein PilJ
MKSPSASFLFREQDRGKIILDLSIVLVLFLLIAAGSFIYSATEGREDARHQSLAAEQQLLSQRIAINAIEAAQGDPESLARIQSFIERFENSLATLRNGSEAEGLPRMDDALQPSVQIVVESWERARVNLQTIVDGQQVADSVNQLVSHLDDLVPQLLAQSDEVVTLLVQKEAPRDQVYVATRQLMLIQRVSNNLSRVVSGDASAATAADMFGRDAALYGRVLDGMLNGSKLLQIQRVRDAEVRERLQEVEATFKEFSQDVGKVLALSPDLFQLREATAEVDGIAADLLDATTVLLDKADKYSRRLTILFWVGVVFGVLVLATIVLIGWLLYRDAQHRIEDSNDQNSRNQRAILRLLDEITDLADGDLTAHATVTEDITGAIADSVNYAIDYLRDLVSTINRTAVQVTRAATDTQGTATRLADASSLQAREIASASGSVSDMAEAMNRMSETADQSAAVALQSVDIASKGAEAVRLNVQGMDNIREQIQETSKRIKRLGESSQEIGDIIGLINEIADRTNILALNAAIQASTAGEAGRGFAVVADEVQRLAERASDATKQVEALVKTIQADTSEAVASMEQSTAGVVSGAGLAENAGESLAEIETVSQKLAELIQNISGDARSQAMVANTIANNMGVIRDITIQTAEGTAKTASSIGNLTELSAELRETVAGFKLPEGMMGSSNSFDDDDAGLAISESGAEIDDDMIIIEDGDSTRNGRDSTGGGKPPLTVVSH